MSEFDYDLFTIGAGSGGVRASRVSAAHGAKVAIAEEYRVGGTCVIRGCVPKKMLVYGAHFAEDLDVLADVDRLEGAYTDTLENHEVEVFKERARLTGPHEVTLESGRTVTAKHILIATGARPRMPECQGAEHAISSNEAFHLDEIPKKIIIAGGGYIANEFAGIFNEFGGKVTIVNRGDQLLRSYDESVRDRLLQISIKPCDDGGYFVKLSDCEEEHFDCVMFATGRVPNTEGLGLEDVGVELGENGEVVVDRFSKTSVDHIHAVGDVTDRVQLTPVAIREGQAFADSVFGDGEPRAVDHSCTPSAVFSHPPIAAVGMTEGEAKNALGSVKVYESDFRPMKNVLAGRNERSLFKMICDASNDKIVGIHMIAPEAPEMMQAAAIAVKAGLTKADFDATTAIHPTMAEELVLLK
jgi:glutathione reductase (NADPH)